MRTALLIVDHGSTQPDANEMLHAVGEVVRRRRPDLIVEVAHMELAAPGIQEGFAACVAAGAEEVVVHPYMLAPGRHATEDIPRLVQEAATRHPGIRHRVTPPLGLHEKIGDVILERAGLPAERPDEG